MKNGTPTQAFVLVGGKGSRLGNITENVPKPLLEVAGRPFLDYVISWLALNEVDQIILLAGHLSNQFINYKREKNFGVDLVVVSEKEPLGTGGAIFDSLDLAREEFIVCNGDSICLFPLQSAEYFSNDPDCSYLVISEMENPDRYGIVEHRNGSVMNFQEKEIREGVFSINTGIYIFKKRHILEYGKSPGSLENSLLTRLAKEQKLQVLPADCNFLDIGVPKDFDRSSAFVRENIIENGSFKDWLN